MRKTKSVVMKRRYANLRRNFGDNILEENKAYLCKSGETHIYEVGRIKGNVTTQKTSQGILVVRFVLHVGITCNSSISPQLEEWRIPYRFYGEVKGKIKNGSLIAVEGIRKTFLLWSYNFNGNTFQHLNIATRIAVLEEEGGLEIEYAKQFRILDKFQN